MNLSASERGELVLRACEISRHAYAKYSSYLVGACLLTEDGSFFEGVNVENASYGLTNCAERTAVFSAVTAGQQKFKAIAVASRGRHAPCGACRQVLVEFHKSLPVLLVDPDHPTVVEETTLAILLPGSFELPPP